MPFDRFAPDPEELKEREAERQVASQELAVVQERIALFRDNPLWDYLDSYFEAELRAAFEEMFTAPVEAIEGTREKIRHIRHLRSLPNQLADLEARLLGELDE